MTDTRPSNLSLIVVIVTNTSGEETGPSNHVFFLWRSQYSTLNLKNADSSGLSKVSLRYSSNALSYSPLRISVLASLDNPFSTFKLPILPPNLYPSLLFPSPSLYELGSSPCSLCFTRSLKTANSCVSLYGLLLANLELMYAKLQRLSNGESSIHSCRCS